MFDTFEERRKKLAIWKNERLPLFVKQDVDALDRFMVQVASEMEKITAQDHIKLAKMQAKQKVYVLEDEREEEWQAIREEEITAEVIEGIDEEDILAYTNKKLSRKKDVANINHSTIHYPPFRKDFYVVPPELQDLKHEEVKKIRAELDGIKVVGKDCPKPIRKWTHCGLPLCCLDVIKKQNFQTPTPIQCQAIPAIMSGRDVIGIAKTGSGKTLAFLLPMLRHIKDQEPLKPNDGPIALVMTPTRELALQIHKEARLYGKPLKITSACCYGGSPISEQIAELKRGAEIVVCTPGRMIDLLCANSGRVTNLFRVTYLVLDEADRMFDMGFEPQVMKVLGNVRPSRQTVLFSATFPRQMEALARKILRRPLEITVGNKSVVTANVEQHVEIIDEQKKFLRLLEILGKWFFKDLDPRALIFVDKQDSADHLMNSLLKKGYLCNSLHGGKDQMDRDGTIVDFKSGVFPILIATSVAARGLDVKGLSLVVNFDCPNHKEDYVHRVGRTGRAGNKGTSFTFISQDQERYAPDIVDALKASKVEIPSDLATMAALYKVKVKAGQAQKTSMGFGGKGLEKLNQERDNLLKTQKMIHGVAEDSSESEKEEVLKKPEVSQRSTISATMQQRLADATNSLMNFTCEFEINDYPQRARWKVTNKEQISQISELSGAAITTRGTFVQGKVKENERKLYLFIEGETQIAVDKAKHEIARILKDAMINEGEMEIKQTRYSVV